MKILKWMQKKLNGSRDKKKPNSISASWTRPEALLVIGTFGTSNLKENSDRIHATAGAGDSSTSQDCGQEFTLENLRNELNMYFQQQLESNWTTEQKENITDQPLNSDGKENDTFSDGLNSNCDRKSSHNLDNGKSATAICKKAFVFSLKKMFVCRSGFEPTPSFKDLLSKESRMEKTLRAILHQKLNHQVSNSVNFIKKYLENRHMPESDTDEEEQTTDAGNGSKWNNTDSEYIVLEI